MDYISLFTTIGFPAGLLFMIFIGGWRVIEWSATWMSKRIDKWVDPIVDGHLALIRRSSESLEKVMEALVRMEGHMIKHSEMFDDYAKSGRDYMREGREWRDSQRGKFLKAPDDVP